MFASIVISDEMSSRLELTSAISTEFPPSKLNEYSF